MRRLTRWIRGRWQRRLRAKVRDLDSEVGFLYEDRISLKSLVIGAKFKVDEMDLELNDIWATIHDTRAELAQLENGMISALQSVYLVAPGETRVVLETLREAGLETLVTKAEYELETLQPLFLTEAETEVEIWQQELEEARAASYTSDYEEAR